MKPTGATKEWEVRPLPIHGYQIIEVNGNEIVRDVYRKEDAEQIVKEHNAIVFALECGRNWSQYDWHNWLDFHARAALNDVTPSTSAGGDNQSD